MPLFKLPGEYATYLWFTADDLADPDASGSDHPDLAHFDPEDLTPEAVARIAQASLQAIPTRDARATAGPTRTRRPSVARSRPQKASASRGRASGRSRSRRSR